MKLQVQYEAGKDDQVEDPTPETGIMVGIVADDNPVSKLKARAVIVNRDGKVLLRDVETVTVIDREIADKLDALVERYAELGLEIDVD